MNKKHLIMAWIIGILLSCLALYKYYQPRCFVVPVEMFTLEHLPGYGLPFLVVGVLFVYTIRDNKSLVILLLVFLTLSVYCFNYVRKEKIAEKIKMERQEEINKFYQEARENNRGLWRE